MSIETSKETLKKTREIVSAYFSKNYLSHKIFVSYFQLQKEVLVGQWNGDKEIEIEVNSNLSAEEKESGFLKHITKKQGKWPIIIIHNSRPEVEKIQIAENQTDEGEMVKTATIIMPATKSAKN